MGAMSCTNAVSEISVPTFLTFIMVPKPQEQELSKYHQKETQKSKDQHSSTLLPVCQSQNLQPGCEVVWMCGHTLICSEVLSVLGYFSLLKVSQMCETTDTCRPGEAHPSPVRHNAGFEYSLAIVALYPAVIPSFPFATLN